MFHVWRFEPHTCIVAEEFGALEMHLLLLLEPTQLPQASKPRSRKTFQQTAPGSRWMERTVLISASFVIQDGSVGQQKASFYPSR